MDHLVAITRRLPGTWRTTSSSAEGGFDYFRITSDLKLVSLLPWKLPRGQQIYGCYRRKLEVVSDDLLICTGTGWRASFYIEGDVLKMTQDHCGIIGEDRPGSAAFTCHRLTEEEIPEWFEEEFQKAMAKPWR